MLEFLYGVSYAVCVELNNFYLFVFEVFCLFRVWQCGDVKSWDGCCLGEVCVMGVCGESRDV